MAKFHVWYEVVGGPHGDTDVTADSASEAKEQVKYDKSRCNGGKPVKIKKIEKKS